MQLVIVHRRLVVGVLMVLTHTDGGIAPGYHEIPDGALVCPVVENIIVAHLPHAQRRVAVLQDHSLEGHVPDFLFVEKAEQLLPACIQQKHLPHRLVPAGFQGCRLLRRKPVR